MSEPLFNIVFFGIIQTGKDRDIVMDNMAKLFHSSIERMQPYFGGGRKVIKAKIDARTAEKYIAALENAGLVVKQEEVTEQATSGHNDPLASSEKADHSQQQESSVVTPSETISLAPPGVDIIKNPVPVTPQKITDFSFLTMAEAGVDIIEHPHTKSAVPIADVSGLTLAEKGS